MRGAAFRRAATTASLTFVVSGVLAAAALASSVSVTVQVPTPAPAHRQLQIAFRGSTTFAFPDLVIYWVPHDRAGSCAATAAEMARREAVKWEYRNLAPNRSAGMVAFERKKFVTHSLKTWYLVCAYLVAHNGDTGAHASGRYRVT
jgi:hypothetical protein